MKYELLSFLKLKNSALRLYEIGQDSIFIKRNEDLEKPQKHLDLTRTLHLNISPFMAKNETIQNLNFVSKNIHIYFIKLLS